MWKRVGMAEANEISIWVNPVFQKQLLLTSMMVAIMMMVPVVISVSTFKKNRKCTFLTMSTPKLLGKLLGGKNKKVLRSTFFRENIERHKNNMVHKMIMDLAGAFYRKRKYRKE